MYYVGNFAECWLANGGPSLMKGEKPWAERKDALVSAMKACNLGIPTFFTLQEVFVNQLNDIKYGLNGDEYSYPWTHFGTGRDDGANTGEFSPIIYNAEDWNLQSGTQKWLSLTPDIPSAHPSTTYKRIVTICTFIHKQTGAGINVLNTHYDHKSNEARNYGSDLIVKYVDELGNGYPTVVAGDINSKRTGSSYMILATALDDTSNIASTKINENMCTVSGFSGAEGDTIDFIFASRGNILASKHEIMENLMDDGFRFSDHRPVIADITI
ncbi:uncharacterized protein J8A68_001773 [[Candida] subhashii]|uniref:Endonuclease/exonuclease/phosphatase domain-containing protein n=1 Tax=[Candida] subhashii TaxID=561895 RepID=A0A8J5QKC8_9ASCO|nr:uncharacterized protein J8A68_001773 [[Candida] subhashii]KAG7664677.1 hypothetical protein J8A68_001773 [[Candida] subhashii]